MREHLLCICLWILSQPLAQSSQFREVFSSYFDLKSSYFPFPLFLPLIILSSVTLQTSWSSSWNKVENQFIIQLSFSVPGWHLPFPLHPNAGPWYRFGNKWCRDPKGPSSIPQTEVTKRRHFPPWICHLLWTFGNRNYILFIYYICPPISSMFDSM